MDETLPDGASARGIEAVARRKAQAVLASHPDAVVLAADTLVVHDGEALGQPADETAARTLLRRLSGERQDVITGIAAAGASGIGTGHVVTGVRLDLSDSDIEAYLATGAWQGKAGAYGLQDAMIGERARFWGSWSNVVGLDLDLAARLLQAAGVATRPTDGLSLHNAFSEGPK